jgi:hypothetical protein
LKSSISEKDVKIRNLELELEKMRNALAEANLAKKVASTPSPAAAPKEEVDEEDANSNAAAGAATAFSEEEKQEEGVVSSNSVSGNAEDVELPHNSNSLTE